MDLKKNALWFFCGFAAALTVLLVILLVIQPALSGPQRASAQTATPATQPAEAESAAQPTGRPSKPAMEALLKSDLQMLRGQLELYNLQHRDCPPGTDAQGRFYGELLVSQMTRLTNKHGQLCASKSEPTFGPYMQSMPANPFVPGPNGAKVIGGAGPAPGHGKSGWYFDTKAGMICPNDREHAKW